MSLYYEYDCFHRYDRFELLTNYHTVNVESGFDGDYVVFDDYFDLLEFLEYLSENGVDTSFIPRHSLGSWDENAIKVSDIIPNFTGLSVSHTIRPY